MRKKYELKEVRDRPDIIHGTIPYNGFEEIILQTPLLMRLHRISQNSLVFLTFPSNNVKRFEHSLGVMHLSGKCLRASLINTDSTTLNDFFASFKKELNDWAEAVSSPRPGALSRYSEKYFDIAGEKNNVITRFLEEEKAALRDNPFFDMQIPGNILPEYHILCACLFQGVRLAGLLHDLGHLPYSHTLEAIMKILYVKINAKEIPGKLTEDYASLAKDYIDDGQALHEALSEKMFSFVEWDVAKTLAGHDEEPENNDIEVYSLVSIFSFRIAYCMLYEKKSFIYQCLHSIISGTVDADRLDYVSRDAFCSAVSKEIINYDRLFLHYAIRKDGPIFIAAPELKSILDIEYFLCRRWQIFRDINFHHSVHKSELIMRRVLVSKAKDTFAKEKSNLKEIAAKAKNLPDNFILGIMIILKHVQKDGNYKSLCRFLLMLDDAWLDTLIKHSEETPSSGMLTELIDGRKMYKTVIKRSDGFIDFDEMVFKKSFEPVSRLIQELKKGGGSPDDNPEKPDNETFGDIYNILTGVIYYKEEHLRYVKDLGIFFTNNLLKVLATLFLTDGSLIDKDPINCFEEYIYKDEKYNQDTLFLGAVDFNTGISAKSEPEPDSESDPKSEYKLWKPKDSRLVYFQEYSSIDVDLDCEKQLLPPFHIYIKNDGAVDCCLEYISSMFSQFAIDHISRFLKDFLARGK